MSFGDVDRLLNVRRGRPWLMNGCKGWDFTRVPYFCSARAPHLGNQFRLRAPMRKRLAAVLHIAVLWAGQATSGGYTSYQLLLIVTGTALPVADRPTEFGYPI